MNDNTYDKEHGVERDEKGRVKNSLNPNGKPKGSRNKNKVMSEEEWDKAIDQDAELALKKLRSVLNDPKATPASVTKAAQLILLEKSKKDALKVKKGDISEESTPESKKTTGTQGKVVPISAVSTELDPKYT